MLMTSLALSRRAAVLLLLVGAQHMGAQQKDLEVLPNYTTAATALQLTMNKPTVALGDTVEFHFVSNQTGYVTLWDIGTSGRVVRLYPNRHGGTMLVQAGQRYGAGGAQDSFQFQATAPTGMEDVYAVWTRTPDAQPKAERYANAAELGRALQAVERLPVHDKASAKLTFEVVQPGAPVPAPLPAPTGGIQTGQGTTYLLALGANVGEITKANHDAKRFADTMQNLLHIPPTQVRVVENARVHDFRSSLVWLRERSQPDDLVVIFFSGHGSTIPDDNKDEADGLDEVFVMYDAHDKHVLSIRDVVRDDQFNAWLNALRSERVAVFIDSCFSGGLHKEISTTVTNARVKFFVSGDFGRAAPAGSRSAVPQPDLPGGLDGTIKDTTLLQKAVVYAAAQEQQYALEVSAGGLFTTLFLKELRHTKGGDISTVFHAAAQRVQQASKNQQIPVMLGNTTVGSALRFE